MLSATIWWAGIFLEVAILFRGFQGKFLSKYSFFYAYCMCVLCAWVPGYFLFASGSPLYGNWYWVAQFISLIVGYGILLEIFKHVLSPYPGAEKVARITGLVVFAVIFCSALIYPLLAPQGSGSGTMVEFERDLRTVQAVFIFAIMAVISYYRIPIGRNMRGMVLGYGLYIGTSLVSLAVRSYADAPFTEVWRIVQPVSYDFSSLIWLVALWSFHPNPAPESAIKLEGDYERLVTRVRRTLGTMRTYFVGTVRP